MSRRPYLPAVPRARWYLGRPRYRAYMLREATCVVVAVYCGLLLAALAALGADGPQAWDAFLAGQRRPAWVLFHAAALVYFWFYQSAPWFRLAPKAIPLPARHQAMAARCIVLAHYLACAAISATVLYLAGVF